MVVRSTLDKATKDLLRACLMSIAPAEDENDHLARFKLQRFVNVTDEHYASEKRALRSCRGVRA